jgi:2-methylisocitrate lyase-like PEP mutase family enzyme
MPSIAEKRREFRRLHEAGCFVIPNPWDVGTARYLQGLGFKALAGTSSGYAFSRGLADGRVPRDGVLAHVREIAEAADIPLNVDYENGFAEDLAGLAKNVQLCVDTGVAGLSIEDSTGDPKNPLYDFDTALERVRTARAAIDKAGGEVFFTARSEGFIRGRPDLAQTVRRITAYKNAGADCLYAPGIRTREEIEAIVKAAAPKAVLMSTATNFSAADLAGMGVRRISVGGTLSRVAWHAFINAAKEIAEKGTFKHFEGVLGNAPLNEFFLADEKKRHER